MTRSGPSWRVFCAAFLAGTLAACGATYALRYRVGEGEDIAAIAAAHRVTEQSIRDLNRLGPDARVRPGDIVFVPAPSGGDASTAGPEPAVVSREPLERAPAAAGPEEEPTRAPPQEASRPPLAEAPVPKPPAPAKPKVTPRPAKPKEPVRGPVEGKAAVGPPPAAAPEGPAPKLAWPVNGRVMRGFGRGPAGESRGIDIEVPEGGEVRAAAAGKVIYAGTLARSYGALVIVEHSPELHTVYGNLKEISVTRGDAVSRGQPIATAGQGGSLPSPSLHFEVRQSGTAVDPLLFLPRS